MRMSRSAVVVAAALLVAVLVPGPAQAATTPAAGKITITAGLKGFDTLGVETAAQIACLSRSGYSFDVIDVIGTAWQNEYTAAAQAGMDVSLFQGYDPTTWPNPAEGTNRASIVASKATTVGFPRGGQIFLNLENNILPGKTAAASAPTAITWVENWAKKIKAAGYTPGVYVGVPQALSATQLNSSLPDVAVFWRSASSSAPQTSRGYVMRQTAVSAAACGISGGIDTDVASADAKQQGLIGAGFAPDHGTPADPGAVVPVTPTRLLDTRTSHAVPANGSVTVTVGGKAGIPAVLGAATLNVTVVSPAAAGYLTAYPAGSARPMASNLNFVRSQTVANLVTVGAGSGGAVTLFNGSPGTVQLIADVQAYTVAGTPSAAGTFLAVPPARLLDTRNPPHPVPAGGSVQVVLPAGIVPNGAAGAAVLNVTVTAPGAVGYITAYPTGGTLPTASNLNFVAGQTVPNLVTAKVGTGNAVTLYNGSTRAVQLIVDLQGYYLSGSPTSAAGAFTAVIPSRLLDTRLHGAVAAGSAVALTVAGYGGVPTTGAWAAVLNVTVVGPTAAGYVSVFPSGTSQPTVSNINFVRGGTVPNLVTVPIGRDGSVVFYNGSAGTVQILADVDGYVAAGS